MLGSSQSVASNPNPAEGANLVADGPGPQGAALIDPVVVEGANPVAVEGANPVAVGQEGP